MKKFKFKRSNYYKKIIIFILFIVIFILLSMIKLTKSNPKLINYLLKEIDNNKINLFTSKLDNLLNTYYFNEDKVIVNKEIKPIIYLYNTHNKEKYNDNTSIYIVTKSLKNNLEKLGIKTIQNESKTSDYLDTSLSYYEISRNYILNNKDKYNIAYFIDIHRDSVTDTTITINNKKYAKILFVLGLDNPNYKENKKVLEKMNDYLNKNYYGISRGIYEKKGSGVDGVYNQDLGSNVILIEIGGINNNYEETNNSTEIISLMLYHILGDNNEIS